MLCPIDESPLEPRLCGTTEYHVCPMCQGAWLPATSVKALLSGERALSRDVLRAATPAWSSVAVEPSALTRASGSRPIIAQRELPRRYHCSDCGAVLRMRDKITNASPCTRCGAVWIERGGEAGIAAWYRHAMQAGAMAMLEASSTTIPHTRVDDEDASARSVMILLIASFAAFVVFGPKSGRGTINLRHVPALALGLGGATLLFRGLKHPSRYQIGALTHKGFAFAIAGVALVIAAILSWG